MTAGLTQESSFRTDIHNAVTSIIAEGDRRGEDIVAHAKVTALDLQNHSIFFGGNPDEHVSKWTRKVEMRCRFLKLSGDERALAGAFNLLGRQWPDSGSN